jgi:hypothetical protein
MAIGLEKKRAELVEKVKIGWQPALESTVDPATEHCEDHRPLVAEEG